MRRALLALAGLAILVATLKPDEANAGLGVSVWCVYCDAGATSDMLVNLLLFLPLGAAIQLNGWRGWPAWVAPALLSAGVETAQFFIPGRGPSLGDLIFNTSGAAAGIALVRTAPWWLRPPPRPRRFLLAMAAALPVGAWALVGCLSGPDFPRSAYFGQWTPFLANLEWYRGRVTGASLGPIQLPTHRLEDSDQARRLLLNGERLEIRAVAGPRTTALAPLLSIADDSLREILIIGPDRDDLVLRYRTRGRSLRLDQPDLRFPGVMRGIERGDTLSVALWRDAQGYCLQLNDGRRCGLRYAAGNAWAFLMYPESLPRWLMRLLTFGWVAALLIPLGLWIRPRALDTGWAALALMGSALVPQWVGLAPFGPEAWLSAAVGLGVGVAIQVLVARLLGRGEFVALPPRTR